MYIRLQLMFYEAGFVCLFCAAHFVALSLYVINFYIQAQVFLLQMLLPLLFSVQLAYNVTILVHCIDQTVNGSSEIFSAVCELQLEH